MSAKRDAKRKKRAKAKKKRNNLKRKSGKAILLEKVRKSDLLPGKKIVIDNPGSEKMSEVILDFAEPMLNITRNDEEDKKALTLAIIIWNISLLPEEEQDEAIKKLGIDISPPSDDADFVNLRSVIDFLLERKKKYFSNNNRAIVDYHISETRDGLHLDVASTLHS